MKKKKKIIKKKRIKKKNTETQRTTERDILFDEGIGDPSFS
jgi:hypothetical protein